MIEEVLASLNKEYDEMVEIRRHLHENPELSFEETETAKYIASYYEKLGMDFQTGIGGNGIKVTIDSGKEGKTLALRADFDALPIEEETGLPFASKNPGVMHACGHDGHTAYMMVLAKVLNDNKELFNGKIVIIHQPAEEQPPGGAQAMIKDGILDGVDNVVGIHVMSQMKFGTMQYVLGDAQSGRAKFTLKIKGKGGHGSSPHEANDAIVAASNFVMALQTIRSRRINPFDMGVVTVGSFDGKGQFNIIKDSVTLEGDVRAMSEDNRQLIEDEVKQIVDGLAKMYRVECELDYANDYPVLYNNPEFTQAVVDSIQVESIENLQEIVETHPQAPSEDFAYYAQERPSAFLYVGAAPTNGESYPHHHPKFDIEEKSMLIAAQAMAQIVANYFK